MWCRSRHFKCILLVFFRRWGRLVMCDLIKHDALLWLLVVFFNSSDWCISILAVKEHDRDIRLARTETCAVSEHAHNTGHKPLWNEVKFIDGDPYYYTRRDKEAIHTRLHPDNINRDSGIEIPEVRMSMIKKHNNRRAVRQRTAEGGNHLMKQRGSKCTNQSFWEKEQQQLITAEHHAL